MNKLMPTAVGLAAIKNILESNPKTKWIALIPGTKNDVLSELEQNEK